MPVSPSSRCESAVQCAKSAWRLAEPLAKQTVHRFGKLETGQCCNLLRRKVRRRQQFLHSIQFHAGDFLAGRMTEVLLEPAMQRAPRNRQLPDEIVSRQSLAGPL